MCARESLLPGWNPDAPWIRVYALRAATGNPIARPIGSGWARDLAAADGTGLGCGCTSSGEAGQNPALSRNRGWGVPGLPTSRSTRGGVNAQCFHPSRIADRGLEPDCPARGEPFGEGLRHAPRQSKGNRHVRFHQDLPARRRGDDRGRGSRHRVRTSDDADSHLHRGRVPHRGRGDRGGRLHHRPLRRDRRALRTGSPGHRPRRSRCHRPLGEPERPRCLPGQRLHPRRPAGRGVPVLLEHRRLLGLLGSRGPGRQLGLLPDRRRLRAAHRGFGHRVRLGPGLLR